MIKLENRRNLRQQIVDRLFEAILQGELQPGERIGEIKLARQLGVGQSTLREALQELEHRGLITKHENRGSYVTKLTLKEVEQAYALRLELEPMAAALACERATAESSEKLKQLLEEMEGARRRHDFTELLKSDLAFHQLIWKLSGNRFLERMLNLVCPPLFAFYLIKLSAHAISADLSKVARDFAEDHKRHERLLAALKTSRPEEAKTVFRETVEVFRARNIEDLHVVDQ